MVVSLSQGHSGTLPLNKASFIHAFLLSVQNFMPVKYTSRLDNVQGFCEKTFQRKHQVHMEGNKSRLFTDVEKVHSLFAPKIITEVLPGLLPI